MFRRCLAAFKISEPKFKTNLMLGAVFVIISHSISLKAQDDAGGGGGGGSLSSAYTFEITPFIGKNLPYDLWGTPDNLKIIGVRGAFRVPNPNGAIEASFFYHYAGPDKAYTTDVSYRYEVYSNFLNGYFNIGVHFSRFSLEPDLDANGDCVLPGCVTDSGQHSGLTYGGGIMLPVGTYPIRLGVRFYQNPQSWLLLEAGYGFRF